MIRGNTASDQVSVHRSASPMGARGSRMQPSLRTAPEVRVLVRMAPKWAVVVGCVGSLGLVLGRASGAVAAVTGSALAYAVVAFGGLGAAMFGTLSDRSAALFYPIGFVLKLVACTVVVTGVVSSKKIALGPFVAGFVAGYLMLMTVAALSWARGVLDDAVMHRSTVGVLQD